MSNMPSVLSEGLVVADTYEVERLLGRGGMGEVWLARHRRLAGKQVAIKVLHTGGRAPNPEVLARFRREAEIAARLEHPNIVQVLDFNSLPTGEPYLVMEALKGEPLVARLRAGALPVAEVQAIMRQVGSALMAAHAAGVVHRDLKPENIYLVPTSLGDQVKVLDFGISKLSDSSTVQTTDSVLIGTPLYMSPEQALGHNRDITPQSDLFSLGSIAYELLAGKAPFVADNIAKVVFRIAYEPHAPLLSVAPQVPAEVARGVEHALEKDRAKRTPDIAAFVLEVTGQALAQVATSVRDSSAGVYTPGMKVSDSLAGGATVTPSTGRLSQPAPQAPGVVDPAAFGPTVAAPTPGGPGVAVPPAVVAGAALGAAVLAAGAAPGASAADSQGASGGVHPQSQASSSGGSAGPGGGTAAPAAGGVGAGPASAMTEARSERRRSRYDDDEEDEDSRPGRRRRRRRRSWVRYAFIGLALAWVGKRVAHRDDDTPAKRRPPGEVAMPSKQPVEPPLVTPVPAVDAGAAVEVPHANADAVPDAGATKVAAVVDAGVKVEAKRPAVEVPSAPASPEELDALAQADALVAAEKWSDLFDRMRSRQAVVTTPAGRRRINLALALAACHRHDLSGVNVQLNRLAASGLAAVKEAKAKCRAVWPESGL